MHQGIPWEIPQRIPQGIPWGIPQGVTYWVFLGDPQGIPHGIPMDVSGYPPADPKGIHPQQIYRERDRSGDPMRDALGLRDPLDDPLEGPLRFPGPVGPGVLRFPDPRH